MTRKRTNRLLRFLAKKKGSLSPLMVLTHNHPDPDTIASAWALAFLAERLHKIRTRIVYGGIIGRMENQMLVRVLRIPVHPIRYRDLEKFRNVVLVDTQPPFQNNLFPARRHPTIIIDHHHRHSKTQADLTIIDEDAGATATLLTEAIVASGLEIPSRLATALVYAIASETQNLGRGADPRDVAAYRWLFQKANMLSLAKIQNPPRPSTFFNTLGKAIRRAFISKDIIGVHLGSVANQDIVSHMADFLLSHEKMRWSIVTGRYEGRLCISLRTRRKHAAAGKLLWRLLGEGTSAGGHAMIAGGSVMLGNDADEDEWEKTEDELTSDFLKKLGYKEPVEFEYPFQVPFDEEPAG